MKQNIYLPENGLGYRRNANSCLTLNVKDVNYLQICVGSTLYEHALVVTNKAKLTYELVNLLYSELNYRNNCFSYACIYKIRHILTKFNLTDFLKCKTKFLIGLIVQRRKWYDQNPLKQWHTIGIRRTIERARM